MENAVNCPIPQAFHIFSLHFQAQPAASPALSSSLAETRGSHLRQSAHDGRYLSQEALSQVTWKIPWLYIRISYYIYIYMCVCVYTIVYTYVHYIILYCVLYIYIYREIVYVYIYWTISYMYIYIIFIIIYLHCTTLYCIYDVLYHPRVEHGKYMGVILKIPSGLLLLLLLLVLLYQIYTVYI